MATNNTFKCNVYEINGIPQKNIYQIGFSGTGNIFLNYNGNDTRLNGVIQTLPNQYQYAVVETVAQLVTLSNS